MPSAPPHPLLPWIEGYAVRLGSPLTSPTAWVTTASGAELAFVGGLVVKLHHPRTEVAELRTRLALATDPALAAYLVAPASSGVAVAPVITRSPLVTPSETSMAATRLTSSCKAA